jgi:hypothetical protein
MVDRGDETNLGGFEGIVSWELNIKQEQTIFIRS